MNNESHSAIEAVQRIRFSFACFRLFIYSRIFFAFFQQVLLLKKQDQSIHGRDLIWASRHLEMKQSKDGKDHLRH